ncbi:MAG: DoxX family protein [Gemmatirosa sp.]
MRPLPTETSDRLRDLGPLPLRLFAGTFLIYMSQDNVFSAARMGEFTRFLEQFGFPLPALAAPVSVYAQFAAGLLFLAGLWMRPAAAVMIVNFVVALAMVHTRTPFREALDPSAMLAASASLLLTGAGAVSLDAWLPAWRARRRAPAIASRRA